jgi:hypothetical protein
MSPFSGTNSIVEMSGYSLSPLTPLETNPRATAARTAAHCVTIVMMASKGCFPNTSTRTHKKFHEIKGNNCVTVMGISGAVMLM